MSRPFSSDYADARTLPAPRSDAFTTSATIFPSPVTWQSYQVTYHVTDRHGNVHRGRGVLKRSSSADAQDYAEFVLEYNCPQCAGFTGHVVTVTRASLPE